MIKLKDLFLDEATRQEIQQNYSGPVSTKARIQIRSGIVDTKRKVIEFKCVDLEGSREEHIVTIKMGEHSGISRGKKLSHKERIELALVDGELLYKCDCKSYTYGGFGYISNVLKSALPMYDNPIALTKDPKIRNKEHLGLTCKHIKGVADQLESYVEPIANVFIASTKAKKYGKFRIESD